MKRANSEGSIYKDTRRGVYIAAISCGRDHKTGRLIRRTKHCRTKAEAVKALAQLKSRYTGNTAPDGGKTKLIDCLTTYYVIYKSGEVRDTTATGYTTTLNAAKLLPIARRQIETLTPSDIQAALKTIASVHTRRRVYIMLNGALRQAAADGHIQKNPLDCTKPPKLPPRKELATITPDEAAKLVKNTSDPVIRMSIQILYSTGARVEEMLALTWPDFDPHGAKLTISKATNPVPGGGATITATKNKNSVRTITIPHALAADLIIYRRWQSQYIMAKRNKYDTTRKLIITYDGHPMYSGQYGYYFRQVAKAAQVAITPRGLRHTHATELFCANWNAKDVQKRLGHASISITMDTYTHYIAERGEDIAAYIETIYPHA